VIRREKGIWNSGGGGDGGGKESTKKGNVLLRIYRGDVKRGPPFPRRRNYRQEKKRTFTSFGPGKATPIIRSKRKALLNQKMGGISGGKIFLKGTAPIENFRGAQPRRLNLQPKNFWGKKH